MSIVLHPSLSPQTVSVYRMLLKNGEALTAAELGRALHIFPQAAYRAAKPLVRQGMIEAVDRRPIRFRAKSATESLNALLLATREWFESRVRAADGISHIRSSLECEPLNVSFIINRKDVIDRVRRDTNRAMTAFNLIVSGFEVPAETMLANKQAIDRGVVIRILVQRQDADRDMLINWQRMGIKVKLCSSIDARIITIDDRIAYLVSYNPNQKEEGLGVRFDYPPIARLMRGIFEERWNAEPGV